MKVIIADDQALLRKSLGQIISTDDEIEQIQTVSNGKEAVEMCCKHRPDIILMDIEMPEMDGISAMKSIKENCPKTKVIILTTFDNKENIVSSFLAQADGYITKDISPEELIATIKCVNFGLTVIHKSVKDIMVEKFEKLRMGTSDCVQRLSEEEILIVKFIVQGLGNKEIGKRLNYSEGTVKNKVSAIYGKLNLSDRVQLAVYAVENGI